MDVYSVALILAIVAVAVSVLAALLPWIGAGRTVSNATASLRRLGRLGALFSLLLLVVSLVVHLVTGHRPGTPMAMTVPGFVLEHPAFVVVAALAALVLWWLR